MEWETAWAQLWLKVDGQTITENGFSANYWGATYTVSGNTQPKDYDRTVSCEIYVGTNCCGSASGSDSMMLFAELTPYVTVGSDTENYIWNGVHRRDIWYQIWHSMEDPACIVTATQQYRLSNSAYQMILEQAWRWDYTGIWRQ